MAYRHRRGGARRPASWLELCDWIRRSLQLTGEREADLIAAIETVFRVQERRWRESKRAAVDAVVAGCAERVNRIRLEVSAKDESLRTLSDHFERVVRDLTDRARRDPKTQLMQFTPFLEQMEAVLVAAPRGRWCGVGLADISDFKSYNDAFGHAVGDRIIQRVADLLRANVRSTPAAESDRAVDFHARFGGDEFCFMTPDLAHYVEASWVAERFRHAVAAYDWSLEDARLRHRPVRIDIGVVCLLMDDTAAGAVTAGLASRLIERADALMYTAKRESTARLSVEAVHWDGSDLMPFAAAPARHVDLPVGTR